MDKPTWEAEDVYWRNNFRTRTYTSPDMDYDYYRPAYRYGFDAADQYRDREWDDIESELSRSWNTYEHRGESTWQQVKNAVRDAWDRVTGARPVSARR